MSATLDHLTRALNALGADADAVADRLLAGGWTGLRGDGIYCPLSNYAVAVVPDVEVAAVAFSRITVVTTHGDLIETSLPHGAAKFVAAFDSGSYDELAAALTRDSGDVIDDLER